MQELSWVTREHEPVKHGADWYWTLGIIALASLVSAIIFDNLLFGILIVLALGLLAYLSVRPPEDATVTINEQGIFINDFQYPYRKIKTFWVDTADHKAVLLFTTDRFFLPMVSIPIGDMSPDNLRLTLRLKIKEEELRESQSHKVMEALGF